MCGIVGICGQGDQKTIKAMADSIRHRGPDDEGFYFSDTLYFGFRRLSIIDLSLGHQPLSNEDGTVWIVFNGEIYNFSELRKDLERRGHQFKTSTDTEVIVHLYEEEGENFLSRLSGMFALAIWDQPRKKLLIARDRLGKKPLFYSVIGETLIFGSEIKALLANSLVKKELDFESLYKYLIYEYVPAPGTIIKNVKKLEAGHLLVWQGNKLIDREYWDVGFNRSSLAVEDRGKLLDDFNSILEEAVTKRLVADVPLGIFLSGGLDSSTIAYFAQKNSDEKIKTFSIGFSDKSFDETGYSQQVADFLHTDHYHRNCTPEDLLAAVPAIAQINDEPLADASVIPTHLLSNFTRQEVTVALSGDGGDELLAGYPTFLAMKLAGYFRATPKFSRDFLKLLADFLPVSFDNFSFDFKLKRLLSGYEFIPEIQNQIWLGSFTWREQQKLFFSEIRPKITADAIWSELNNLLSKIQGQPLGNRLTYLYLKQYLADDILVKADRASMFNSLEVRAPFLDYQLVDFLNSVPYQLKLKGFTGKYLLKELMKDKLPADIVYRPKKGFGIPVAKWLNQELKSWTDELLDSQFIKKQGIFNSEYVKQILTEHRSHRVDQRKKLWTLLIFQTWYRHWFI
jgi:asparagine synthase (glutamine-hydrolysing)